MSVIAPVGLGAFAEADDNHIKVQLSGVVIVFSYEVQMMMSSQSSTRVRAYYFRVPVFFGAGSGDGV
ncbi:hypothetical protein [Rothia dentocariosa]|uniref:hypothetical protein n=1 Tax=Rothia dentocariosa TaxID=2047 RepID=UPI0028D05A90|nr:hypothetical protein [Rothia dentocariosa]